MSQKNKDIPVIKDIPWSYPVRADDAGMNVERITISPDEAALGRLKDHFINVDAVENLSADLVLKRVKGGLVIYIKGHFRADILQTCVKFLEPMKTHLEEDFEAWYADPDQAISFHKAVQKKELQRQQGEAPIIPEEDDPEPIENGIIDLGDVVTQFVSLSIDPYPLKEGNDEGVQNEVVVISEDSPIRKNPFEALKDWKNKMEDKI